MKCPPFNNFGNPSTNKNTASIKTTMIKEHRFFSVQALNLS
jgi:hypothetical protein